MLTLARNGADVIELGVPFTDPMADGPTIQASSQRALQNGVRLADILELVRDLRTEIDTPIVLFGYLNPLFRYGFERLANDAAEAGVLTKGQRAIVKLAADNENLAEVELATLASYEIDEALSWQQTRVVFDDTLFEEVIAAFNRYNERRLILGDQALRTRRITGVFRADNLDGFVRLLEAGSDVRVESRSGRETVLHTR